MSRHAAAQSVEATGVAVELHGAGQVGGALLADLQSRGIPVAAIHRRRGIERRTVAATATVLVDATPPRVAGMEAVAWVRFLADRLRSGTPVVTCNKAPLALAWTHLDQAARAGGAPLVATATVGGGTPILPGLRSLHSVQPIHEVQATLSGTLGFVLPRVHAGATLDQAIAEAQAAGWCEPDPRFDLEGTDSWVKACIVHNLLWPEARLVQLDDRPAALRFDEDGIRRLSRPAVVARIAPGCVTLGLEDWPDALPGAGIQVRAVTGAGALTLSGPGAGVQSTARRLAADVEGVARGSFPPGIH